MRLYKTTSLFFGLLTLAFSSFSQGSKPPVNWQNLDFKTDGVPGMSTEKAYKELLANRTGKPVVVAVIDGGVDVQHEDLKDKIWTNSKEVAGDSLDNDGNGYVDDMYGWNFIGNANGENVQYDNLEMVRQIRDMQPKYVSVLPSTPLSENERRDFLAYQKMNTDYMNKLHVAQLTERAINVFKTNLDSIIHAIGKDSLTIRDFKAYKPKNKMEGKTLSFLMKSLKEDPDFPKYYRELEEGVEHYEAELNYHLNMEYDSRPIVGDDYENSLEHHYGNADVEGPDALHGTHVAGIIAANRQNNLGVKGVADQVKIMVIRVVPDGDERDKDVANGIFYAVNNGAKVINMSFGKAYVKDKQIVDSAVRYAMKHDVLLVHAAGNEGEDNDSTPNYPNRNYVDSLGINSGVAAAWIEVGASSWKYDASLVTDFSNYGKKSVDVFAPGLDIHSTVPDSKYREEQGTSMAAPMVSGLAALIWSYYPQFKSTEIKKIIMNSVFKPTQKVKIKRGNTNQKVLMDDISVSGGIVNAYEAIKLAEKMTKK